MAYFGEIWSNLKFNAGSAASQFVSGLNWRYGIGSSDGLKYVSQSAYKSVLVYRAKQLAMSTLEGELNSFLPKLEKRIQKAKMESVREQQEANRVVLLKKGEKSTEDFGRIDLQIVEGSGVQVDSSDTTKITSSTSTHTLIAKTKYGTPVPEALILSFDLPESEEPIEFTDVYWKTTGSYSIIKPKQSLSNLWQPTRQIKHNQSETIEATFKTRTVFHIDLAPKVSMSSTKNVVLTQVQGRDYSRKELVSGGDLTYSVQGEIVSDEPDVYPTEAVKRFMRIMQHPGVINVNFIMFGLLGVKKVIIKDFSLKDIQYKNVQPYSFTCVAVEPDDIVTLSKDTIATVNTALAESKMDAWYASILDSKLGQIAAQTVANNVTSATTHFVGAGLDELVPNI